MHADSVYLDSTFRYAHTDSIKCEKISVNRQCETYSLHTLKHIKTVSYVKHRLDEMYEK